MPLSVEFLNQVYEIERKIISFILKRKIPLPLLLSIKESDFSNPILQKIFMIIKRIIEKNKIVPSFDSLLSLIGNQTISEKFPEIKETLLFLKDIQTEDDDVSLLIKDLKRKKEFVDAYNFFEKEILEGLTVDKLQARLLKVRSFLEKRELSENTFDVDVSPPYDQFEIFKSNFYPFDSEKLLRSGALIFIGGTTNIGKSFVSLEIAHRVQENYDVCFLSLEMSSQEVWKRRLARIVHYPIDLLERWPFSVDQVEEIYKKYCSFLGVENSKIDQKELENIKSLNDFSKFISLQEELKIKRKKKKFYICDMMFSNALSEIKAKIYELNLINNVRVFFLDQLQNIRMDKNVPIWHNFFFISRDLKELARDLNIALVVVTQSNVEEEQELLESDLLKISRYAGAIIETADSYVLLLRLPEDKYLSRLRMRIIKSRHSKRGAEFQLKERFAYGEVEEIPEEISEEIK